MKPGTYPRDHEHGGDRCRQAFRARVKRNGGDREKAIAEVRAMGCDYSPRGTGTPAVRPASRTDTRPVAARFSPPARKPEQPQQADTFGWGLR